MTTVTRPASKTLNANLSRLHYLEWENPTRRRPMD